MKIFLILPFLFLTVSTNGQDKIEATIITGGHGFNRDEFFKMFDSFENLTYQEAIQPKANRLIENKKVDQYDVLIFYDMYDSITESQKKAYLKLLQKGKPMIFLHHSLVSYQDWPEFTNIIGGKFNSADTSSGISTYKHDATIPVKIVDTHHPITDGLKDFEIFDETYGNCVILKSVHPLLSTDLPTSMPHLAWTNEYKNSQIVYIQSGHGPSAYTDPNFRKLLKQAILWAVSNN